MKKAELIEMTSTFNLSAGREGFGYVGVGLCFEQKPKSLWCTCDFSDDGGYTEGKRVKLKEKRLDNIIRRIPVSRLKEKDLDDWSLQWSVEFLDKKGNALFSFEGGTDQEAVFKKIRHILADELGEDALPVQYLSQV